jgi:hypothetical protein
MTAGFQYSVMFQTKSGEIDKETVIASDEELTDILFEFFWNKKQSIN